MEKYKYYKELRIILFLLTIFLVIIFLTPFVFSLFLKRIPYQFQPPFLGSEKLYSNVVFSQHFVSPKENLSAIGLSIRNFNLQSKGDIFLEVFLDGRKIRESVVKSGSIKDGDLVIFTFEKIPDSFGKNFVFKLRAPDTDKAKAYEVYTTNMPQSFVSDFYINDSLMDKTISFMIYTAPQNRLVLAIEIYKYWFSRLYKDTVFFYFYSSLILVLIGLAAYFYKKEK
ncbi:MAG: hypothetical protein KatS3mg088_426 [Patescibacteria group bacterium]|nr:MAG: hypothetical protein KatS3mg088_426 [Patescibacteria group bacterium]